MRKIIILISGSTLLVNCGSENSSIMENSIRPLEKSFCEMTVEKKSIPTPLCGAFSRLPTWKRGDFRYIYLKCPEEPKRLDRVILLKCDDPT